MSEKVLVLGGTGFLGKHVVELLAKSGMHEVHSVSRREGLDILDAGSFTEHVRELAPDVVVNCAAHVGSVHYALANAGAMIHDNMQLVINLYEAVRAAAPEALVVNPLSNCSYPGDADTHYEPDWERGAVHDSVLPYGSVKRMTYAFAESYRKQYGIRSVNWLVANAYGPGDYLDPNKVHALNGIIIRLIEAKRAGAETFEIWGSGKPLREWVYIEDVARIMTLSLDIPEQTYPLNLAQNKAYSISEIAAIAARALDYDVRFTYDTSKPDGAPVKVLDDRAFRAAYPDFSFTPLSEGIRNTVAFYEHALQPA